jgi:hypothetical protein
MHGWVLDSWAAVDLSPLEPEVIWLIGHADHSEAFGAGERSNFRPKCHQPCRTGIALGSCGGLDAGYQVEPLRVLLEVPQEFGHRCGRRIENGGDGLAHEPSLPALHAESIVVPAGCEGPVVARAERGALGPLPLVQ